MVRDDGQHLTQEIAILAGKITRLGDARRRRQLEQRLDLRRGEPHLRHILKRVPVERLDVLAFLLIEAAARLVAQPAALHDLVHPGRKREILTRRLRQPRAHVSEHIESGEVAGAEGGGLCTSDKLAGEAIHLVNREVELLHQLEGREHPEDAQPIGHEARHVLAQHDPLTHAALGKLPNGLERLRRRVRRRDEFEQVHVARRVEIVRAEKIPPEGVAAPLQEDFHRNARRVGGDDGVGSDRLELREQLLLGTRLLDDDLDDPVAVGEQAEMIRRVAGGDQCHAIGIHERRGLGLLRLLQSLAGRARAVGRGGVIAARNVEQDHGEAGGGGECGDAAPHHACTDHAHFRDAHQGSSWGARRRRKVRAAVGSASSMNLLSAARGWRIRYMVSRRGSS